MKLLLQLCIIGILCILAESKKKQKTEFLNSISKITDKEHKQLISEGKLVLIYYYVPQKIKLVRIREIETLREFLKETKKKVKLAFLDCDSFTTICSNQSINNYPTVIAWKDSQRSNTFDDLKKIDFIKNTISALQTDKNSQNLMFTLSGLNKLKKSVACGNVMILLCDKHNTKSQRMLTKLSKKGDILKHSIHKNILKKLNAQIGDIMVAGWDNIFHKYEGKISYKELVKFISKLRYKKLVELDKDFNSGILGDKKSAVFLFTETESFELKAILDKSIHDYNDDLIGISISEDDTGLNNSYKERYKLLFGIVDSDYPAIRFLKWGTETNPSRYNILKYKLTRKQKIDTENIKNLLSNAIKGDKIKPYYLSENPTSAKQLYSHIQPVVGKNFNKILKSFSEDTIIILYNYENSEICAKCNIYITQLNKVAIIYYKKIKNSKEKVKFQAINGRYNEIRGLNLSIKPGLFFIRKTKDGIESSERFTSKWQYFILYRWIENQHKKPVNKITDLAEKIEVDL